MNCIRISNQVELSPRWPVSCNENCKVKHVDLEGCTNNYEAVTGYLSDVLRCIGWRYKEKGNLCYEVFNVGHLVLDMPVLPGVFRRVLCWLQGKKPAQEYREAELTYERTLNCAGWKIMLRSEQR